MKTIETTMTGHKVVSREEWIAARKELLDKEKELTRLRDQLSAERRELPWVKVEKQYVFDGPDGKETLADLFDGRSQLVIYHFMFGPDWKEGCPSCSFVSDHIDGTLAHLAARDVTMVMVSRAPLAKIEAFKKRMGWRFKWVSSYGSDFNPDFHVSFTKDEMAQGKVDYNYTMQEFPSEEAPGISVFYKDAGGDVFHTYSTYGRGVEPLVGTYMILDMVPKGRDEDHLASRWNGSATMIVTVPTSSRTRTSPTGRRRRRRRPPPADADRRRRTREHASLLRNCCERLGLWVARGADQGWRAASADARPALSRHRRLDCSGRDPGAGAEVPRVSGRVSGSWDWLRAFARPQRTCGRRC